MDVKVSLSSRKTRDGVTYHMRWRDPCTGKFKSKLACPNRKAARKMAGRLEDELNRGTYRELRRTTWVEFVQDHASKIPGKAHAREAKRTLAEFGKVVHPTSPKAVTYAAIEQYVAYLRSRRQKTNPDKPKNTQGTINKKLRYIHHALNMAVKRGLAGQNVSDSSLSAKVDERIIRVISDNEERVLLETAESVYGFRYWALLLTTLNTGGRASELFGLPWSCVDFDADEVCFTKTKSHTNRYVPIEGPVVDVLRRLKLQTMQDGGPFVGLDRSWQRRWEKLLKVSEVDHVTLHDLRRTYITRLIREGVPLPTVQKLAGHVSITTTLKYYNAVSREDLRAGVKKLNDRAAG